MKAFSQANQSAKEYKLDTSHSSVEFSIKHMMISTVKGNFRNFESQISFESISKIFNSLKASVEASSIDTGNDARDNHLRSADFFEVETYPNIDFVMSSYDDSSKTMSGELTIKGNKKPVELKATINGVIKDPEGNERVGFTLKGKINRKDFGLTWNKAMEAGGLMVGDSVDMNIEIQMVAS